MLLVVAEAQINNMKAKLLKEQMGVPAGAELEVIETGRAWTLRVPSGYEIVVPACDVEALPEVDPKDPQPEAERALLDDERDVDVFPQAEPTTFEAEDFQPGYLGEPDPEPTEDNPPEADGPWADDASEMPDDDLDEDLPATQDPCEGDDTCESCQ